MKPSRINSYPFVISERDSNTIEVVRIENGKTVNISEPIPRGEIDDEGHLSGVRQAIEVFDKAFDKAHKGELTLETGDIPGEGVLYLDGVPFLQVSVRAKSSLAPGVVIDGTVSSIRIERSNGEFDERYSSYSTASQVMVGASTADPIIVEGR